MIKLGYRCRYPAGKDVVSILNKIASVNHRRGRGTHMVGDATQTDFVRMEFTSSTRFTGNADNRDAFLDYLVPGQSIVVSPNSQILL